MTPKNILYMTPSVRLLGARRSLLALVQNLDPRRYRPIVCCQTAGALSEELAKSGVECVFIKTGWWRKGKYWPIIPIALWRLRNLVRRSQIDLIHCNEIYPNPFACFVGKWTGVPVVTHMRLSVTERLTRNYRLRDAKRIVVVSDAAGHDFDHWEDKKERVTTVHNGVDPRQFASDRPREQLRKELGWPADAFIVGHIATWAHRKRQLVAIEAVAQLAERLPRLRLAMVGGAAARQSDYEEKMRRAIAERGLGERVQMLPFTDDLTSIYNAIDLNILISGDEGFGRTPIEAATAGRPSIGTQVGGIPEVIAEGKGGWLIPLDDPAALAERMEFLARNPEALAEAGRQARLDVDRRFSIDEHARKIQALYDEILNS